MVRGPNEWFASSRTRDVEAPCPSGADGQGTNTVPALSSESEAERVSGAGPLSPASSVDLARLVRTAGWPMPPAMCHGVVVGALIGDPGLDRLHLEQRLGEAAPLGGEAVDRRIETGLDALRLEVLRALHDEDCRFRPDLGTSESGALGEKVVALADWVEGALAGLGETPGLGARRDAEIAEILGDFAAIARLDRDDWRDGASEEDAEVNFEELYEFVRVASLYLFDLLHGRDASTPGQLPPARA